MRHSILFLPENKRITAEHGETVLQAARRAGVFIDACCGGGGVCGKCAVNIINGTETGRFLSCEYRVYTDITAELPGYADDIILKDIITTESGKGGPAGYGIAADIGTTTIAVYLCSLQTGEVITCASALNPQIPYGADVISRIAYAAQNEAGLYELKTAVYNALNRLIKETADAAGIEPVLITKAVIAGNTVMQHIALYINPKPIGFAPYNPVISESAVRRADDIGLITAPEAEVYFPPCPAGFIGGDTIAALISERPYETGNNTLLIDIGTNSEICLCTADGKIYATSCATGPALEGAQIKHGMRAAKGAVETVSISPETGEPRIGVIGGGAPAGICGSGVIDAVSQMAAAGIIEPCGRFSGYAPKEYTKRGADVYYSLYKDAEKEIAITQKDIRAVQLAKAALYAGAKMLIKQTGAGRADNIILAGAFGGCLDKLNAYRLGMFPDCRSDNIITAGNAAGKGACMILADDEKRREAEETAKRIVFIETANMEEYPRELMAAIAIPHETDLFFRNTPYIWKCSAGDNHTVNTVSLFGYDMASYPYTCVREITPVIIMRTVTDAAARFEYKSEAIPVELPAPFALLASMVNPAALYTEKDKDMLRSLLHTAAAALARAVGELTRRGVRLISVADAQGAAEFTGMEYFLNISGKAAFGFLELIRPYMTESAVYLCGKLSYALHNAGLISVKPYRCPENMSYADALIHFAKQKSFKFLGHGCIHKQTPVVYKLELI